MGTLLGQHLRPEPFPNVDGEFIDCRKSGNQGNTCAGIQRSEIKLIAYALIWNRSYRAGNAGSVLDVRKCFRFTSRQKGFGERMRHEGSRSGLRAQMFPWFPGLPAVDEFPIDIWERLRSQVLAQKGAHLLRHASSRGDADLRKAVATYLCDFRGARCHPDQILIVGGMQQAMLISAMALVDKGEPVWIEDPGFHQARRVFVLAGARVVPKPLDEEGIVIARSAKGRQPKLIHVTPSHQYPLGMTMSFDRRRALLDFARAHNAFIFEDDFYAEFRFTGPPLPCLQGIDNFSRVIYAGTMSKILYPSLRLGYVVAPEQLIDSLVKIRSTMDQHSSAIDQATLARFINEGFFLSHIRRMRKLYAARREFFMKEFNKLLGDRFTLQIPEAGLNFVAWLRSETDFAKVARLCADVGIKPSPLSFYCIEAKLKPAFVFGFAAWTPAQIRESLLRLASALR